MADVSSAELPADLPHPRFRLRPYLAAGFLALLGFGALAVDLPLSRWFAAGNLPGEFRILLRFSEVFSHGLGVVLILWSVWVLDPSRRWAMPRLATLMITAGVTVNLVKLAVGRTRPRALDSELGVLDSFTGLFPLLAGGSANQSVPSGHATMAAALAVGLIWLYPRGWYLFTGMALLAAMQRLEAQAHYLSDLFWGASLGMCVGWGLLHGWLSNRWLDRLERWMFLRGRDSSCRPHLVLDRATRSQAPDPPEHLRRKQSA